jgi:hypothetical protein
MHATLSKLSADGWRMLKGSAGILPALSSILPDSMKHTVTSDLTRTFDVRWQHAGGSGQNARTPQS